MPNPITKPRKKKLSIDDIAKRIARDLFTNGNKDRGDHLKMYAGDKYLGGWGEGPMADRIAKTLKLLADAGGTK